MLARGRKKAINFRCRGLSPAEVKGEEPLRVEGRVLAGVRGRSHRQSGSGVEPPAERFGGGATGRVRK